MSSTVIVILISVGAVALFVLGISLTFIFKGHHIKSEISDNENMRQLGIKCAAQQMREEECDILSGKSNAHSDCVPGGCASCDTSAKK